MSRKKMMWLAFVVLAVFQSTLYAQEEVFGSGVEFGVGARAMGMGGAFMAVGDDYTASYWNPAALALIRRFEVLTSLSRAELKNETSALGLRSMADGSNPRVNSLGFAYPVPTYRGSLVFSLGYNSLKPYDSRFNFEFFNDSAGDSVQQSWFELDEGSLNNWTFAGAVDVSPNLSVGLALNYWTGKDEYQSSYLEQDIFNYDVVFEDFRDFRIDNNLISEFSGFNLKLGGLYRVNSNLRIGATIATPTTLNVTDNFTSDTLYTYDQDPNDFWARDEGSFEYKIRSPFVFGAGASLNVAGLLVAGSVESVDWSQIRYVTEPPIARLTKSEANEWIVRNYRSTTRLRAGAEFTFPGIGFQVRAGYHLDPTPLKNLPDDADREFITLGVGFLLNKQVKIDVAYITGEHRPYNSALSDFSGDSFSIDEKVSLNKVVATLAFRL